MDAIRSLRGLLALTVALITQGAAAQAFPTKPIRLIVPYPPGGIDPYARVLLPKMNEVLGQPLVIDNRGGANGFIGTELAAHAAPDGHTLLFVTASTIITGVFTAKKVPFDTVRDFTPVSGPMFENLRTLTVHGSLPFRSVKELVEYAKANPGKLSYASSGIGSNFHLDGELFKMATGADIVHVPYKGTAPMTTDLVAGRIEVGFASLVNVRPHIAAGKVRLLALMESKRSPKLPDTPVLAEIYPGLIKSPAWTGIVAPAGLPRAIVDRVHSAVLLALREPDAVDFYDKNGATVIGGGPDEFAAAIRRDLDISGKLVKSLAIEPE
jgi:tripartite-type tricarboxylate transporter receptor subunit TctC